MSNNSSNIVRKAYMSNFSTKKKHRYIVTEKGTELSRYIQNNIISINDNINYAIQELSIKVTDRQMPFIIVENMPMDIKEIGTKLENNKKSIRGIIRDISTDSVFLEKIGDSVMRGDECSHSIEYFTNTNYNGITFSNIHFDVKVLTGNRDMKTVFSDIFLDSAMFNSFSFLKEMNNDEKHEFGKKKFEFYKNKKLDCYYRIDEEDKSKILYYSLAFSCRISEKEFDYDKYISLWDDFINEYYHDCVHIEKSVSNQLAQYVHPEHISRSVRAQLSKKPEGAYLLLRVNKEKTTSLRERIMNYFGMRKYRIGKIKIVDISEYYKIQDMLKNLDVAAYKVVITSDKND